MAQEHGKMTWEYRVIRTRNKAPMSLGKGHHKYYYDIREVYYKVGAPKGDVSADWVTLITDEGIAVGGDTYDEMLEDRKLQELALGKPILDRWLIHTLEDDDVHSTQTD